MGFRLLATDLDGTLLDQTGGVHEEDHRAILELQRLGVIVTIATGRMYSGTRGIARFLDIDAPVCCVDGSHIVDPRSDAHLLQVPIPALGVAAVADAFSSPNLVVFAFGGDGIVYDPPGERYLPYIRAWTPEARPVERVLDVESWAPPRGPTAYVALGLPGPVLGAYAKLGGTPEVQSIVFDIQHPLLVGRCGLIVRGPGATKGTGVQWIAERHGIGLSEVVTVGDWLNDIPMLQAAGRSFAMGQAPDAVKSAATDVLAADSRRGGGILEAAVRSGWL